MFLHKFHMTSESNVKHVNKTQRQMTLKNEVKHFWMKFVHTSHMSQANHFIFNVHICHHSLSSINKNFTFTTLYNQQHISA